MHRVATWEALRAFLELVVQVVEDSMALRLDWWVAVLFFFLLTTVSCRKNSDSRTASDYEENGRLWAHGQATLGDLEGDVSLLLKRQPSAQPFDTYAIEARSGSVGKTVAYVDFHGQKNELLAYAYQVEFRSQDGKKGDVYVVLNRGGRSFLGRQFIRLGEAIFSDGIDRAILTLTEGWKLSRLLAPTDLAEVALHHPDVEKIAFRPWQGVCPRVSQTPEDVGAGIVVSPVSSAVQELCRPVEPELDFCAGDPVASECRPRLGQQVFQPPVPLQQGLLAAVDNLEKIDLARGIFAMARVSTEARLEFRSGRIKVADSAQNLELCGKKFLALGTTLGGIRNEACLLVATPSEPREGYLNCALTVTFDRPRTYMERVCHVAAFFIDSTDEVIRIQVLKR